jgi:hypothetical protein
MYINEWKCSCGIWNDGEDTYCNECGVLHVIYNDEDDIEEEEDNSVDLIASGYDWECPNCGNWAHTIEITEKVKCDTCSNEFKVHNFEHAYG